MTIEEKQKQMTKRLQTAKANGIFCIECWAWIKTYKDAYGFEVGPLRADSEFDFWTSNHWKCPQCGGNKFTDYRLQHHLLRSYGLSALKKLVKS